jgi:hypothetical protein
MKKVDVNFLIKDYTDLESLEKEYYANDINAFLEYLRTEENHFNHNNDELSPEVYIEVDDFLEPEDIKSMIISLSDLFSQVGSTYKIKLDKEDVLEKIESQLNFVSIQCQKCPSSDEHIRLMLEKIFWKIQQ